MCAIGLYINLNSEIICSFKLNCYFRKPGEDYTKDATLHFLKMALDHPRLDSTSKHGSYPACYGGMALGQDNRP